MAIAFHCSNCGKLFRLPDQSAGRTSKCWGCQSPITVPFETEAIEFDPSAKPVRTPAQAFRTEHTVDPAPDSEPEPSADEELRFEPDPEPIASRWESEEPAMPAPLEPPTPSQARATIVPHALPPSTRSKRSLNPGISLNDTGARAISMVLLLASIVGAIYVSSEFTEALIKEGLPQELAGRMNGYTALLLIRGVILFAVALVPTLLGVCAAANFWTTGRELEAGYVRAAGAMCLPTLMGLGMLLAGLNGSASLLIGLGLFTPLVLLLGLKELMGLRWSTTLVAALVLMVVVPVEGLVLNWIVIQPTNRAILSAAGLDENSIQRWRDEQSGVKRSPQIAKSSVAESPPEQTAPASISAPSPPQPAQTSTPDAPVAQTSNPAIADAAPIIAPENLFTPIEDKPLPISKGFDDEFDPRPIAFGPVQVRPLKGSKIDLGTYEKRAQLLRWVVSDHVAIEITLEPLMNAKQQRPWVSDRESVAQAAGDQDLFALVEKSGVAITEGRVGEIAWTRAVKSAGVGSDVGATYIARLPDQWLVVRLRTLYRSETAAGDRFIQRIAALSMAEKPGDAFDAAHVVSLFDDLQNDPTAIIRASGEKGIEALIDYVLQKGPTAPARATRLLDELIAENPDVANTAREAAGSRINLSAELRIVQGASSVFDKEASLKRLTIAKVDEKRRDEVAGALESVATGSDSTSLAEPACKALRVWWRPQTVPVLLPLLEENVSPPTKRNAAMRTLAATRDPRAVYPIVRWIIKEPGETIASLIEMGPVAETEVMKLLRERDATVRSNASQILSEIGTAKCLPELRRAANDSRDPSAAASAKSAVERVVDRTKRLRPAASATAPTP